MATKTAVVTGATQGLGRALATALAHRGWTIVLIARTAIDVEETAQELGALTKVRAVVGDIAREEDRRALAEAARAFGKVDLLVNNAGTLGTSPLPLLLDYDPTALRRVFDINVVAQIMVVAALRESLGENATIINVSSDAAVEAYETWGGYGISKAALDHASRVLAAENPQWRVLSVDPGDMRTAMHQAAFPEDDIGDRPEPEMSVPGLLGLIESRKPSGRYAARDAEVAA